METIDGIEIASSYKEYIDLALGDLKDRIKKSRIKIDDFRKRIDKRTRLLDEVVREINRRKSYALKLTENDRLLRKSLIRSNEMKKAINNLAHIAGYKLSEGKFSLNKSNPSDEDLNNQDGLTSNEQPARNGNDEADNDDSQVKSSPDEENFYDKRVKNASYVEMIYIQMTYNRVNEILARDKQMIIELVRRIKNNSFKLKELEKLRLKIDNQLAKLKLFDAKLADFVRNEIEIETILTKLVKLSSKHGLSSKVLADIQETFDHDDKIDQPKEDASANQSLNDDEANTQGEEATDDKKQQ